MAQFNVNLAFNADTGKAKTQIAELQSLLSKIAYTGSTTNVATALQKDLQEASVAAKELQFHLNNAFNTSTGKFDLSLLDRSLKTSGANITDLSTKLLGAGATGQQAFVTLAKSISLADQPMIRISKRMQDFAVTMKNTVKWQLSSSMLHGFMGAVQSAYGYAQDLNKSLNDIRIVTGYNTDKMAEFAEQANKAAKVLSTTTTDYTNASLIYFQQGLTDKEVAARTDITVKMANAAGQSAEIVSEQLTAVWNNFANGSKSLEYYADVMTALGAATASSSDEISEGLSKFSAVAESVGLSYEYATAALTTITSNTRESADIVGNALKTLFARLQGLKLGETLEDGVDLNKYSEALDKAGISIFEQNGELKAMDNILNDMAAKWGTMSNTQQVALAQTVAGVRQYNQLIALMENWDNGDEDSMMANLKTIENADGALQKQADIYAQSWEAAQKRVQAAAEGIYQSLLDDDFFISISNGFANLLSGLDAFIDNAGGVKTVLIGIAGIVSSVFANQIPQTLDNFKYNLEIITKGTQAAYDRMQTQMTEATQTAFNEYITSGGTKGIKENSATGYAIQQANELTVARNKLTMVSDKMSASEKQLADMSLSIIQSRQEEVIALKQKNEAMQKSIELQKEEILQASIGDKVSQQSSKVLLDDTVEDLKGQKQFYDNSAQKSGKKQKIYQTEAKSYENALKEIQIFSDQFDARKEEIRVSYDELHKIIFDGFQKVQNGDIVQPITSEQLFGELDFQDPKNAVDSMIQSIERLGATATDKNKDTILEAMRDEVGTLSSTIPDAIQKATGLKQVFDKIASKSSVQNLDQMASEIEELKNGLKAAKIEGKDFENVLKGFHGNKILTLSQAMKTLESNESDAAAKAKALQRLLNSFNPGHIVRLSEAFSGLVGFLGSTVTIGNSIKSMLISLGNPDLSGWEKFSSVIMGITIILPSAKAAFEGLNTAIQGGNQWIATQNLLLGASSGAFGANAAAIGKKTMAEIASYIATQKATGALEEDIIATVTAKLMTQGLAQADAKAAAAAMVHAGGVKFLNGALTKLGALLTWVKGHMLLAIGIAVIAVSAIAGIIHAIDKMIVTQKEANKIITEANNKYDEEKQKLDELKNSLESVQDQIKELQSQDSLSLVEQEELDKLLEQEASLQRQVALQEQLAQAAKQESADAFEENVSKASKWINDAPTLERSSYVEDPTTGEYIYTNYLNPEQYKELVDSLYFDKQGNLLQGLNQSYEDHLAYYEAWKTEYAKEQAKWVNANKDSFDEVTKGYQNWYDIYSNTKGYEQQVLEYANLISNMNKAIYGEQYNDKVLGSMDKTFQASEDIADQNIINNIIKDLNDGILELTAEDIANSFSDTFKNSLLKQGILPKDYAQHLLDDYERAASALANTGVTLEDLLGSKGFELSDLDILANIKLTGEETLEDILAKIENYKNNTIEVGFNLETWKSDYAARMKVINDLETGDTISAEDYALLGEEYQQYFQVQADGTAILIAKAEDLKNAIDNISLESLKEEIGSQQSNLDKAEDIFNKSNNSKMSLDAITSEAEQGLLSTEQQTQYIQAVTEAFGGQYESAEAAAAAIRGYQASLNENQNILASTADNIDELNEMMKQGAIDAEEYYNNIDGTVLKEANKEGFDTEELLEYAETLESVIEDQENAESISKRLALQNQKLQKGIDSLGDNWKDWSKVLKTGNKDSKNYIEALTGIKNAMSDMLDIDVSLLSEEFVTSSETAKLLEKAVKGDLDAIDQLRVAAAKDIVQKVTVDLDEASQESVLASIMELANTDVTIGASLDSTGFTNALNEMILNSQMTIDDIMNILNALGWEPEITYKEIPVSEATQSQIAQAVEIYDPVSGNWETATVHSISNADQDAVVRVPIIQGSSTTYGGSAKTAATPPTPKSSGGGGSKTKKETKQRDDEVERYHVVKEQMEELEKQAEKLSKAKDQAFGKGKLDLIEKEIELLDEQIKKQDEYLKQIQKYGEEDKALMIVYGAQFDENGVITNYEQLMDQELAKYNKAVEQYNKNHDEKKFAAAEARYEKFLNDMEQYEETMDEWDEAQAARADMLREIYDLKFEALTYEIEVGIELEEDDLKLLDYYLEKLDDDAFSAAESITLLGKKTQDLLDQSKIYSDGIADLLSLHGLSDERINQYMNGSLTEQELITIGFSDEDIATLREYRDNLLEINKDLSNIREEIYAKIIDAFDAWNEKIIDNIDKIEKLNKVLNSYQNIIDIVGMDTLKIDDKFMNNLSNAIVDNSKKVLDASAKKYKSLQNAQLQAQQQYEQSLIEGNEETIRYWEETLEHINNEVQNAEQDMMDSWQNALQAAADAFDKSIENIINSFEKALSGSFGNLDNLSEMFEQQTEISDRYLADYEKIYQLSKLNRDINNSIDDTDSIKAKRILKSLQEDINDLQNSEKEMSQYDLEYLQKKYELKLAEIALEEAQNAKSTVRLMQDSEGNWSYVYTNDQEKISDAQQGYEDALFDMQVTNEDYIQDLQEKALDAQKAMTEAIKSIDKTQFATEDAYKERIDQIREYYMDQQNYYYDEMAKALGNNKELYENDWLNYSNLTNYKISSDKEYVDNFAETTYAQIMGYSTIEEAQNNFIMATDIMVEEIIESYTLWLSNINEIMDLAGTSIDTFASDTENNLDRINTKTNEVADSIDDLSQEIVDDFDYIIDAVSDWEDNYVNAVDTTIQANEDMYDSCNSLIGMLNNVDISISNTGKNFSSTAQQIAKAAADIAAAAQRAANAANNIGGSSILGGSIAAGGSSIPGGSTIVGGVVGGILGGNILDNNNGDSSFVEIPLYASPGGGFKLKVKVNKSTIKKLDDPYPNFTYGYFLDQYSGEDGYITKSDYDKLKKLFFTSPGGGGGGKFAQAMVKMDTGGYTGDWGSDGKIAMLHQKELVLNAEDTQNMLNAVNIVREIARVIDLNAGIQSLGLYLQNLSHLSSGIGNSGVQQNIQITAEFPDAVYHSEIEEAFKTLLNESSQYISREK